MSKICLITSSYPAAEGVGLGSVASFERDYALLLADKGFEVHVFCPSQQGKDFQDENVKIHRFKWYRYDEDLELASLKMSKIKDLLALISIIIRGTFSLLRLSKKEKFDFNFCFWAVPAGLWAYVVKFFKGTPYSIWTLGSDIWVYGRDSKTKWIIRKILKKTAFLYSDGYGLLTETEELANKKGEFMPSVRNLKIVKSKPFYEFNKGVINFLFVGRYHVNKGPDVLLKAIYKLDPNFTEKAAFHFFGGGDMLEEMKTYKHSNDLQNVYINGFVGEEEIKYLFENSNYLIIPSREDSIPVILSDAGQFALPIIATNVGDLGKMVDKFKIGKVVESENINELSKSIEKMIEETGTATYSFDDFDEVFNLEKAVSRFVKDYKKLNNE